MILALAVGAQPRPATLTGLREDSVAWRGETVELTLQIDGPLQSWSPWLTRFDAKRYAGFSAWGDEQPLWEESAFNAPATRLFARRGSAAEKSLSAAPTYRRFLVTAVVRNVFQSQPWIEILTAKPLSRSIGQGALVHAGRAVDLEREGHDAAAAEQYTRALAAPMPKHMQATLEAARDAALERAKTPAN